MIKKIAFIGVGNMASAILAGITSRSDAPTQWEDIILFNKHPEKLELYKVKGAYLASSLEDAVFRADCVMLCVKPQTVSEILPEISKVQGVENKLFVSIAAGISTETVSNYTNGAPVVRVMPNTPMLIGSGVSAICRSENVSDSAFDFVCKVFSSAGEVIRIQEEEMNRIISVTGSSPAYVFMIIKAIYEGAVEQGLLKTEDSNTGLTSKELIDSICNVLIGSALLMKSGTKTPDEQIQTVCSKGGTTERAVAALQEHGLYEAFSDAMRRCTARAEELGSNKK